jgi:nucleotide-binding universal stress UspA family protein
MLGSVAMACVNHAPCPVVVVRTPREDAPRD